MVMAADVKELQTRNSSSKHPMSTNVLYEVPKKPKMKFKAAKVIKFLLNFMHLKPKRKHEDKETLFHSLDSQDCLGSDNNGAVHNFHPLLTSDETENVPPSDQISSGLSLSWSYLVHDPFVSNLEVCSHTEDINESGGIFYNESYFEDDYWQDYHESSHMTPIKSPILHGIQNQMSCGRRLFEPERTPYGEFKRNVVTGETHRRRHASLPNIIEDKLALNELATKGQEGSFIDASEELLDYNQLLFSRPPLGLNIAFDSQLDETNMCDGKVCSVNQLPLLPMEEIYKDFIEHEDENDWLIKHEESEHSILEMSLETSQGSGYVYCDTQLTSTISSEKVENIEEKSICELEAYFTDQISDASMPGASDVLTSRAGYGLELYTLNMSMPSSHKNESKLCAMKPAVSFYSESIGTSQRSSEQCQTLESGYNSSDSQSPSGASSPDTMSQTGVSCLNAEHTETHFLVDLPTDFDILADAKKPAVEIVAGTIDSVQHLPFTIPIENSQLKQVISGKASSSPMLFVSTPSFLSYQVFPSIHDFVSPISGKAEIPELKPNTVYSENSSKRRRGQGQRSCYRNISNLCPRFQLQGVKSNKIIGSEKIQVFEPNSDYLLLTAAANLIIYRLQFKEEIKPYINVVELVEYLKSFYMAEIAKLSNTNVQTVSDYRRIAKEACELFTSDHLTLKNCFCELLIALLANRPRIVSMCEDFIFENLHHFVSSQDYLEAAPELILMLLCNNRSTVLGTLGFPLGCKKLELDITGALQRYIDIHRKRNSEKYSRVKKLFSLVIHHIDAFQRGNTMAMENNFSTVTSVSECRHQEIEYQSLEKCASTSVTQDYISSLCHSATGMRDRVDFKTSPVKEGNQFCKEVPPLRKFSCRPRRSILETSKVLHGHVVSKPNILCMTRASCLEPESVLENTWQDSLKKSQVYSRLAKDKYNYNRYKSVSSNPSTSTKAYRNTGTVTSDVKLFSLAVRANTSPDTDAGDSSVSSAVIDMKKAAKFAGAGTVQDASMSGDLGLNITSTSNRWRQVQPHRVEKFSGGGAIRPRWPSSGEVNFLQARAIKTRM